MFTFIAIFIAITYFSVSSYRFAPRLDVRGARSRLLSRSSFVTQSQLLSTPVRVSDEDDEEDNDSEDSEDPSEDAPPVIIEGEANPISLIKQGANFSTSLNGSEVRVGIIASRWNADIISGLYKGVNESLTAAGVKPSNVFITYVPGAFEIPITAKYLAASKRFDVLICLGCLIKGETMHFEYIAQAASSGIMQVSLEAMIPAVFGVLTVLNKEQAIARSSGAKNEGLSWGLTAVEMGLARMSALGVGRPKEPSKDAAFVTFGAQTTNESSTATEKKPAKPFGF